MIEFNGIPLYISEYVPEHEVWLLNPGVKAKVIAHEGPRAGETIEQWLRAPTVFRIINIEVP